VRIIWRFQTRLILIVVLTGFVPLVALTNVMFARLLVRIEERTYALVRDSLERTRNQIEALCMDMIKLTSVISSNDSVQDTLTWALAPSKAADGLPQRLSSAHLTASDYERLSRVENQLDLIKTNVFFNYDSDILVFDQQGIIYGSCDNVEAYPLKLAYMPAFRAEPWYRALTDGGLTVVWTAPFTYGAAGMAGPRFISVVREIGEARTGDRIGLVMVNVSERNFQRIFKGSDSASTALFTGAGEPVSMTSGDFDMPLAAEARARVVAPGYVVIGAGARKSMVVVQPVARFGWVLVSVVPYAEVVREITMLRAQVYGVTAIGYLVILVVTIAFVIQASRPLRRLIERTQSVSVAGRDLPAAPVPRDRTDLLALSRTVEGLVDRMRELAEEVVAEQRKEQQLRLEMLQAQINPHFLFNALNAIKWTAHMSGAAGVTNMLASLGALLEASMRLDQDEIRLEAELKLLRDFLLIQNARCANGIRLEEEIEEPARSCLIIKLLLQPIVENAVKHARPEPGDQIVVRITAKVEASRLSITISDNGEGVEPGADAAPQGTGIGLRNVRERLRLRYGTSLEIRSLDGRGTEVSLSIPEVRG
jgi:two-component system, sensor histidine kinase YesM